MSSVESYSDRRLLRESRRGERLLSAMLSASELHRPELLVTLQNLCADLATEVRHRGLSDLK